MKKKTTKAKKARVTRSLPVRKLTAKQARDVRGGEGDLSWNKNVKYSH